MGVIMAKGHATSASQASGRQPSQSSDPSTAASATVMDANYLSPYTGGYSHMGGHGTSWGGGSSGDASSSYGYQHYTGSYYAGGGGGGSSGDGGNSPLWNYNAEYDGGAESSGGYHIA